MKIKKYMMLLTAASVFASCDIDTIPEGGTVTEEQKNEVIAGDPSLIKSDMNSLKAIMTQYSGNGMHTDFGFPSIALYTDCSTMDMYSDNHGYNWFAEAVLLRDRIPTAFTADFIWSTYYTHIKAANDVLKTLLSVPEKERPELFNVYIAQAKASRAYDYMQLIQYYQFTYLGHEDALGLPIVDETTPDSKAFNNPRVSVKEVYALIMNDLNESIDLFEKYPIKAADVAEIAGPVAYGLRARANMLMGQYEAAAADADKALALSGATPYTLQEMETPLFNEVAHSWIWGIVITEENDVVKTGIVNWPSHLCSSTGNGYTTGTGVTFVYKRINSKLYASMDKSDTRRAWWIDPESHNSPLVGQYDASMVAKYGIDSISVDLWPALFGYAIPDYTNVKFSPEGKAFYNPMNAQDWPLMRAEEMMLIKAEAIGRTQGVAAGKNELEAFVKGFRAPEYVCKANNLDEFIDEVWTQRRLELWGEGFSLQDLLRLKKPLDRRGTNFAKNVTFAEELPAESPIFIYNIPESETNVNKGITEDQINEIATVPGLEGSAE